jgi:transcriptional regulator
MYTPPPFAEDDPAVIARIIATHPFATIVTLGNGGMVGTHLPFLLDGPAGPGGRLLAHMARGNPHVTVFDGVVEALVIFSGIHTYISPRWYAGHRSVPTWNYEAVHVTGQPRLISDPAETRSCIARLSAAMEEGASVPWSMDDVEADYIEGMLEAIVAFEMPIKTIIGKRKMSQNKAPNDRRAAAGVLLISDDPMAREVGQMMLAALNEKGEI